MTFQWDTIHKMQWSTQIHVAFVSSISSIFTQSNSSRLPFSLFKYPLQIFDASLFAYNVGLLIQRRSVCHIAEHSFSPNGHKDIWGCHVLCLKQWKGGISVRRKTAITVFIFYMLVLHERKFVEKINWIFSNNWIYQANVTRLFLLIIESGVKKYITRWNFFYQQWKKSCSLF